MIIGLNLTTIDAKTKDRQVAESVSVNSTPKILDVVKKDFPEFKELVEIKFSFLVKYEPDIGEIVFEGAVLYKSDDSKRILKKWKDDKKLDDDVAVDVLNAIFRKCLTKAVDLANELRLPPPIRFPIVTPGEANK